MKLPLPNGPVNGSWRELRYHSAEHKVHTGAAEPPDRAFTWTLLFTAVLFLRPQDLFPPLEALHLAELTAIAGLVSLIFGRLSRGKSVTRLTPDLLGVVAFGAVILLTAPFSIWMGGSFHVFQELYSKVILVYLLTVNVISSPRRLERLTWVLVLSVGYVGFRAVLDYGRGVNLIGHGTRVQGSVGGIMQNPNDLALNMVAFLPLAAFLAMRPYAGLLKRGLAALCGLFMIGAIVASGSRGGFLGFVCMVLVLAAFAIRQRPGFVIASAFAVLCAVPLVPASYWHRLASITDSSKDDFGSEETRRTLLSESMQAFAENPLTGVGAGEFKDWNPMGREQAWHESHNVILQVAAELGVIGLSVFLFLVVRAFAAVFQTRRLLRRARPVRRPQYFAAMAPAFRTSSGDSKQAPGKNDELPRDDAALLDAHSAAMAAALVGWFVCALFASVAYNWTFYYLLALAATPREMLRDRKPKAQVLRSRRADVLAEAAS